MTVAAVVFASLAALLHVAFFAAESLLWKRPPVWRAFGVKSEVEAKVLAVAMFNQGFYNLFLAAGVAWGLYLQLADGNPYLLVFSLAAMGLASVVLLVRSPRAWRGAMIQGAPPLLALLTSITVGSAA